MMDPTTLIVDALATGAAASAHATASEVIKDAYHGLKSLVQRKFKGEPNAELVLARHEEKPEVWQAPLKDAIAQAHADEDKEIIEVAQKLLTLVKPQQAAMGKYNVQITGKVQGLVQGDYGQITMTFGDISKEK